MTWHEQNKNGKFEVIPERDNSIGSLDIDYSRPVLVLTKSGHYKIARVYCDHGYGRNVTYWINDRTHDRLEMPLAWQAFELHALQYTKP